LILSEFSRSTAATRFVKFIFTAKARIVKEKRGPFDRRPAFFRRGETSQRFVIRFPSR
jgi:hypothetical protein